MRTQQEWVKRTQTEGATEPPLAKEAGEQGAEILDTATGRFT